MNKLQVNIAEQITSGFVSIDSLDEFKKVLQQFPDDPNLQKAFSDFLAKNNLPNVAATSYGKAAELYLKDGQLLQAMVSKALQWKAYSPSFGEAQLFFSALREGSYRESSVNAFVNKLSNPEIMAVMKNAEIVYLPPGHVEKKVGDEESDLYFIASGSLKKTIYKPLKQNQTTIYKKQHFYLFENDFFGDVYPLQKGKTSQSYIETLTAVELVKISKQLLSELCKKYSNVECVLAGLFNSHQDSNKIKSLPISRRGKRHRIVKKMTLEIYPQASVSFPIILTGYSRDISIGGTCIVLESKDIHVSNSVASFHKIIHDAQIKMGFKSEGLELKVSGKIIWTQKVSFKGEKTLALGVHFQDLSPKLRGMLFVFAESSGITELS